MDPTPFTAANVDFSFITGKLLKKQRFVRCHLGNHIDEAWMCVRNTLSIHAAAQQIDV
ncbi:hypothetical protein D3C85_1823340 [compost metagenome]